MAQTIANRIVKGSALDVLPTLETGSAHVCITSPPYYKQRSYGTALQVWDGDPACAHVWKMRTYKLHAGRGDAQKGGKFSEQPPVPDRVLEYGQCSNCNAWLGELGQEPTPAMYIDHLIQIFREVHRILVPSGSCYVNLGDVYGGSGGAGGDYNKGGLRDGQPRYKGTRGAKGTADKGLLQIPWRFSIRMTDDLGFVKRNDIIWHKDNVMSESAKDRFTRDFEPILFFVKDAKKCYFDTQYEDSTNKEKKPGEGKNGRIKRTTWTITLKGYHGKHYATYNENLLTTPILASCPAQICKSCGFMPKTIWHEDKKTTRPAIKVNQAKSGQAGDPNAGFHRKPWSTKKWIVTRTPVGRTKCQCPAPQDFDAGIVLDPFFGAGTTGVAAINLGRRFIGIELSDDYIAQAERRIRPLLEQRKLDQY